MFDIIYNNVLSYAQVWHSVWIPSGCPNLPGVWTPKKTPGSFSEKFGSRGQKYPPVIELWKLRFFQKCPEDG